MPLPSFVIVQGGWLDPDFEAARRMRGKSHVAMERYKDGPREHPFDPEHAWECHCMEPVVLIFENEALHDHFFQSDACH